jgi:hypothetical protein
MDVSPVPSEDCVYRFVWIEPDEPLLGGQWMGYPPTGLPWPVALADVVAAATTSEHDDDPLIVHVERTKTLLEASANLEDRLFPDAPSRLAAALAAAEQDEPPLDPLSVDGELVRRAAESLEKMAADLAELVQEQLDGGSLATLPPNSTIALCQAVQAGRRLRRLIEPPSPLYL